MTRFGFLLAVVSLVATLASVVPARAEDAAGAPKEVRLTVMNLEYEGTKIWLPGTMVVPKGAKVILKLINNTPSGQHGFAIPAFNVAEVVDKGVPKTVEFVADKEGIFQSFCQLHPAHVGNQLVVLDD
jgi:nitrosocyanin